MKYEISHERLCKVVEKYLDGFRWEQSVEKPSVNRIYLNDRLIMVAYTVMGKKRMLTVFKNYYQNLTNLFQTDLEQCLIDWFNKNFHDSCEEIEIL